ncbi:MAG: LysM peptidoglycan-binding domain-containing protein [Acidimicrobiales bacterium]|nr:LysM peptidoglycan-binding domain-containing protein [Acidimicrobiales bacterium]
MTRRALALLRGLSSVAAIVAIMAAIPLALVRFAGLPGSDIVRSLTDDLVSDTTRTEQLLRGGLALIAWLCWAQLAFALVVETVAAVRGTVARRVPTLPGFQAFAARLVTSCTLVVSSFTPPTPAIAAPLTPVAAIHEPVLALAAGSHHRTTLEAVASPIVSAAASSRTYVVEDRDTFWDLGERFLGDGLRWRDLRTANLGVVMSDGTTISESTEALQPGWELRLPADAVVPLATGASEPVPDGNLVTVERGEHLWQLATEALTDAWGRPPTDPELAPYWSEMIELNRDHLAPPGDPNLIYTGQQFIVPPVPANPLAPAPASPPPAEPAEAPTVPAQTTPPPVTTAPPAVPATTPPTAPTAPAEPAAAAPTTSEAAAENAADDGSDPAIGLVALGIGGLATGAGALALTLRRLRHHQAARRRPGTTPLTPPAGALAYEAKSRAVADTEAARWIEATNRYLTHQLAQLSDTPTPAVVAMRAGSLGVELLLDEPCAVVDGFVLDPTSATAWRLDPALELAGIEAAGGGEQPYSPALVPVGRTAGGDLHLDLEQVGLIAVDGEPDTVHGWMRTIATAIAVVPNARPCEVVALGLDTEMSGLVNVTIPSDPAAWVEQFCHEMRQLNARLDATPYRQRVQPGEVFHPTIVLLGADQAGVGRQVAEVAALVNTPVAIIAAALLPTGCRVHLTRDRATLEPFGIDFTPAITDFMELRQISALLEAVADPDLSGPVVEDPADSGVSAGTGIEAAFEGTAELIERITRKRPVEVTLLGPRPRISGLGKEPPAKVASVIAYLAYHRSVSSQTLRETFWPSSTSRKTADNALSTVRQLLGTGADGHHRLTIATNSGRYELSDEVGCDWTRVEALTCAARKRDGADAIELLRAALQLAEGRIASDADRNYAWLNEDHQIYGRIERVIVDAAHLLGELALDTGDQDLARWAAGKGLAVVPSQESMYRITMRAAAASGDSQGVCDAYRAASAAAEDVSPWTEVQPETADLMVRLRGAIEPPRSV